MTRPGGPLEVGGFEDYVLTESGENYTIRLYADLNNEALQREGQRPVYYWTPQSLRLARFPDTGHYKFSHTHFRGVMDESSVGIDGQYETVGGLINFTVTSRMPTEVMAQLRDQIHEERRGDDRPYWRILGNREPDITMVPIRGNTASVSSLSPDSPAAGGDPVVDDGGGAGGSIERSLLTERGIRHGRELRSASNLDLWAVQLDGTGPGSITGGENAYGGLLGGIPSELIWASMRGNASPFFVSQSLLIPMATPVVHLKITGHWKQVFDHFSSAASVGYLWASAEISAQFETLRREGDIEVEMTVDPTVPGAEEIAQRLEKTKDLVREQFMNAAMKTIFEPVPPVEAAKKPKRRWFWGGGASFKLVKKREFVEISYEESQTWKYNRQDVISSTLEGLRREIAADAKAVEHYFHLVNLGQLNQKVRRVVHPVANWNSDPEQGWKGDPVHAIGVEFGYPLTNGNVYWKGVQFSAQGGSTQTWEPEWVQLRKDEVTNPPRGWEPAETFVRRKVLLKEGTSALEDPHNRVLVEVNEVDLDPPEGTLVSDISVDARADNAGVLGIGPIQLGAVLEGNTQVVELEIKPSGRTLEGKEREVVKFTFSGTDQDQPRRLKIYTGDPGYNPEYQYRVRVIVKATLFTDGMEWTGDWQPGQGNGPLTASIPRPGEEASEPRRLTKRELFGQHEEEKEVEDERFEIGERNVVPTKRGTVRSERDGVYDLRKPAYPAPPEPIGEE